eukprot:UC1_evm1s715
MIVLQPRTGSVSARSNSNLNDWPSAAESTRDGTARPTGVVHNEMEGEDAHAMQTESKSSSDASTALSPLHPSPVFEESVRMEQSPVAGRGSGQTASEPSTSVVSSDEEEAGGGLSDDYMKIGIDGELDC